MKISDRPRRPRALQACEVCRLRKNRCDEEQPCTYCVEHQLECKYSRPSHGKRRKTTHPMESTELATPVRSTQAHFAANTPQAIADRTFNGPERMQQAGELHLNSPPRSLSASDGQAGSRQQLPTAFPTEATPGASSAIITDTNSESRNQEFYGASSSVAFLRHVEKIAQGVSSELEEGKSEAAVDSLLQKSNTRWQFSPTTLSAKDENMNGHFYFRVARKFIHAYFGNIHYIQPIFEEENFLERCEDLWFDKPERQPLSFVALYYATLSLGSLVMVWGDRESYNTDRFSWSRKFFKEALDIISQLTAVTDLEIVQCYYMMSKVCQHELNPHVAYLYSGQATRTALAIGLNTSADERAPARRDWMSSAAKTWWAVYCLDIHISFALGRPDSLGSDEYHTQAMPGAVTLSGEDVSPTNPDVLHIIPCNVEHSRIMRSVSLLLYTRPCTVKEKLRRARELDDDLSRWLRDLPHQFRNKRQSSTEPSLRPRQVASYIDKQFIVLMIRYYNLRMIIHGKFLTVSEPIEPELETSVSDCQNICIISAGQAIDLIHETYRNDNFFQTWWYNSTYTLFAASVLLTAIFHKFARSKEAINSIFGQIERAIEVLEVMEECSVTRNATLIIRRTLARAKKVTQGDATHGESHQDVTMGIMQSSEQKNQAQISGDLSLDDLPGSMDNVGPEFDGFEWPDVGPFDDTQQTLFWGEWARYLEVLGA